ncbi:MAG: FHA domain-containing protein [Ilumatobacteraceae bacterium]
MTFTCPNGHQSADPEWCDTCGAKLGAAPTAAPSGEPAPAAAAAANTGTATPTAGGAIPTATGVDCPHCATVNEPGALFCEGCGYDFTTGQAPPTTEESVVEGGVEGGPAAAGAPEGWLLVVEVDQPWYELKGQLAEQPIPAVSSSTVPLTSNTALIGRTSQSRNLHPEIALDSDTGVSRRHAQLVHSTEGTWTIVDLGSSNGTYVVGAGETPDDATEAIAVGIPAPLVDQDRIYLGAWTKLTLRKS